MEKIKNKISPFFFSVHQKMGDSCTVVILRQVEPFDNEEDYQQLLKLNFGQGT